MRKKKTGWGNAYSDHRVLQGKKTIFHGRKGDCEDFIKKSTLKKLRVIPPNC